MWTIFTTGLLTQIVKYFLLDNKNIVYEEYKNIR